MEKVNEEVEIKYYMRKSGRIVRVLDDVTLEYLNDECEWVPNQEWYVAMFIDGEDEYKEVSEEYVKQIINAKLNSAITGPTKTRK